MNSKNKNLKEVLQKNKNKFALITELKFYISQGKMADKTLFADETDIKNILFKENEDECRIKLNLLMKNKNLTLFF